MNGTERGQALKEIGMKRSLKSADPRWVRKAYWVFSEFSRRGTEKFSADDIREVLEAVPIQTDNPAALGAIFAHLSKIGFIEKVPGEQVVSRREETHNRPLTVWRFRDASRVEDENTDRDYAKKVAAKIILEVHGCSCAHCEKMIRKACLLGMKWERRKI